MTRRSVPVLALLVSVLAMTTGCGTTEGPGRATDPQPATTADPALPDRPPRPPRQPETPPTPVEPADRALADALLAFAAQPGPATAAPLRLAPVVWLGLGENLFAAVPGRTLADPAGWEIDVDAFGRLGPLDALQPVRRHLRAAGADDVRVSVGPHPRCVGPRSAVPSRFRTARQVVLRPTSRSIDSCLQWWSVDLFVGADGLVRGVSLQLWEP